MDTINHKDPLREQLITTDQKFRRLAHEHKRYEMRLHELSALAFPNDEEQLEEATLKKKKLIVKDHMEEIMVRSQQKSVRSAI